VNNPAPDFRALFKEMSAARLDEVMSILLRELRRRDSDHMKGDAIQSSLQLRSLRGSGKLPKKS
jgi:hypothetical protein